MESTKKLKLSTIVGAMLVVALAGFTAGFNYQRIEDYVRSNVLKQELSELPQDLSYAAVEEVYDLLRENYAGTLDAQKLLDGAKKGLIQATGDPYTVYLTADEARDFRKDLDGTFSGIGAEIAVKDGNLVVVAPIEGSPAAEAGLRAGDRIIKIGDEDTSNMSVDVAVGKIRGEAGSKIKLTIVSGNKPSQEISITRSVIEVPAIKSELKAKKVGYIELTRFGENVANQLSTEAKKLKAQGATQFIIDLRNNPGGLLQEAVDVSDVFLDVGKTIVEEKKDSEVIRTFRSTSGGELLGAKVVVLINEGSASASEIVAGALTENGVAKTIGETTFGKGSVQELVKADNGAYLKVTVAKWYTPQGKNISEGGITPAIKVGLSTEDFNKSRDPQLKRALEYLANLR